MEIRFNDHFWGIENVKIMVIDDSNKLIFLMMQYDEKEDCWIYNSSRVVKQYKFVINDIIRLNDPKACRYVLDEKGEVWSVPYTDKTDIKDYMIDNKKIVIDKHGIITKWQSSFKKSQLLWSVLQLDTETEYIYDKPIEMEYMLILNHLSGIHSVTFMCYQPDGRLFHFEEIALAQRLDESQIWEVSVNNRISKMEPKYALGKWQIQIYIDGEYRLTDYFVLKEKIRVYTTFLDTKI